MRTLIRELAAGFLAALWFAGSACAQSFPSRPVRIIVPAAAGGALDALSRIYGQKVSELWGQPVIVENRAGASGNIAGEIVAKAPADGYTLLMMTLSHAVGASLYAKLPFHPANSFSGVTLIGATTLVLLANPSSPAKTLKDIIALAKARPG